MQLNPVLQVSSSVIAIDDGRWLFASVDGRWLFASVDIAPSPCITTDMVRARYPALATSPVI